MEQLPGPKVVLCSLSSLEAGFSRELFSRFAPDLRNTLLFTARAAPGTLAHTMQTESVRGAGGKGGGGRGMEGAWSTIHCGLAL